MGWSRRIGIGVVALALALAGTNACSVRPEPPAAKPLVEDFRNGDYSELYQALDAHARGLLDGDEKAWLALVDRDNDKLLARYRQLYANLRKLKVTRWSHQSVLPPRPDDRTPDRIGALLSVVHCFEGQPCKPWDPAAPGDAAADSWSVTYWMTKRDGAWVLLDDTLTRLSVAKDPAWVPNGPKYDQNWTEPVR